MNLQAFQVLRGLFRTTRESRHSSSTLLVPPRRPTTIYGARLGVRMGFLERVRMFLNHRSQQDITKPPANECAAAEAGVLR
jgi:hypothetical protein